MKSVLLVIITALLLLGISACGGGSGQTASTTTPSSTTTQPTVSPSVTLSEQPDMATYHKYLSDLGIGKMPPGVTDNPLALEKNVSVFAATDQICLYGEIILECQIRSTMYNTATGKVVEEGGLPKPMMGGFAGWEPMPVPVGHYEYKVYVDNTLVGVFPFEVTN